MIPGQRSCPLKICLKKPPLGGIIYEKPLQRNAQECLKDIMKFSDNDNIDNEENYLGNPGWDDEEESPETFEKIPRKPKLPKFKEKDKGWQRRDKRAE